MSPDAAGLVIVERPVLNWSERPAGAVIDALVLHDTGSLSVAGTLSWFNDPTSLASAHLLIDRLGTVYRLVPYAKKAWHAGTSTLWHQADLNRTSIGIELVDAGEDPYPAVQLAALINVTVALCIEFPAIPLNRIVGHEQIATPPGRRRDPGRDFPWRRYLITVGARLAAGGHGGEA